MSWIWPVLGLLIVATIILVSLWASSRRSMDQPEWGGGEAGGPTRISPLGGAVNPGRRGRGRGRLGL